MFFSNRSILFSVSPSRAPTDCSVHYAMLMSLTLSLCRLLPDLQTGSLKFLQNFSKNFFFCPLKPRTTSLLLKTGLNVFLFFPDELYPFFSVNLCAISYPLMLILRIVLLSFFVVGRTLYSPFLCSTPLCSTYLITPTYRLAPT